MVVHRWSCSAVDYIVSWRKRDGDRVGHKQRVHHINSFPLPTLAARKWGIWLNDISNNCCLSRQWWASLIELNISGTDYHVTRRRHDKQASTSQEVCACIGTNTARSFLLSLSQLTWSRCYLVRYSHNVLVNFAKQITNLALPWVCVSKTNVSEKKQSKT